MRDETRRTRRTLPLPDALGRLAWPRPIPRFTADEVASSQATAIPGPRGQAVRRCALRPLDWLPPEPDFRRCPQRYHEHPPRIVFWYGQGTSLVDSERRLAWGATATGPTSWALERAFAAACRGIAARLNAAPQEYGHRLGCPWPIRDADMRRTRGQS